MSALDFLMSALFLIFLWEDCVGENEFVFLSPDRVLSLPSFAPHRCRGLQFPRTLYYDTAGLVEDEAGLGIPEPELLRRGEKVRILHHQPRDFTQEARFSEKDFEVSRTPSVAVIRDSLTAGEFSDFLYLGNASFLPPGSSCN